MKTSEPNDYGGIDCECNRCGDLRRSLEFIICDNFSECGGVYVEIGKKYTAESCPKSDDWFIRGGGCGLAHECVDCTADPTPKRSKA